MKRNENAERSPDRTTTLPKMVPFIESFETFINHLGDWMERVENRLAALEGRRPSPLPAPNAKPGDDGDGSP